MKTQLNQLNKTWLGVLLCLAVLGALAMPVGSVQADGAVVLVDNLDPSWNAPGGGGVFSAYIAPPVYGYVSPGATTLYDGREAGIIKAGLTPKSDGHL